MNKRNLLIILSIAGIILIAGTFFMMRYTGTPDISKSSETTKPTVEQKAIPSSEEKKVETISEKAPDILKSEAVQVVNNSPEYDLKAVLYENNTNDVFLKLEFYNDGTSSIKEIGADKIPELKDLFKNREGPTGIEKGNRIRNIYLNPVKAKLYFLFEGKYLSGEADAKLYVFNLKDSTTKKLFEGVGTYGELKNTKDYNYLAFNYSVGAVSPSSKLPAGFIQILKCDNDEFVVNKNCDAKGLSIGWNKDNTTKNDYSFLSWASNTVARLKETVHLKAVDGKETGSIETKELLFDIAKKTLLNLDGSSINSNVTSTAGATQVKVDSDSIKTLRNYYTLMSTEQYSKANDLLNEKFSLKLNIFKQFGIEELTKRDMDVNNMMLYGDLFKTAIIDSIVDEKVTGSNSTINFYLVYSMGESDQIKQPIVAKLSKSSNGWKIVSVSEGNENESPFKK